MGLLEKGARKSELLAVSIFLFNVGMSIWQHPRKYHRDPSL